MHRLQFNHQSNVLKQWDGRATWYGDLQISCLMHKVTVFVLISNINAHEFNNIVHGYQDDTKQIYTITTLIIWLPDTKASVMFSPPYTIPSWWERNNGRSRSHVKCMKEEDMTNFSVQWLMFVSLISWQTKIVDIVTMVDYGNMRNKWSDKWSFFCNILHYGLSYDISMKQWGDDCSI